MMKTSRFFISSFALSYLFSALLAMTGARASAQPMPHEQPFLNPSLVPSPYSTLKTLAGYQPSVIASEADAKKIYDEMPTDIFQGDSGCFQRAEDWTYRLDNTRGLKSMKVFLFFTHRYQREFDYQWAYHVAPLIPVRMMDGSIQDMVFDPTFTSRPFWVDSSQSMKYDNRPIPVQQWIRYFIYPEVECPVVDNYEDYLNYQERYYCYIMKAPMYNYIPDNFDTDLAALTDTSHPTEWNFYDTNSRTRVHWRSGDLEQMKKAYTKEYRKK